MTEQSEQWDIEAAQDSCCFFSVRVTAGAKRNFAGGIHQRALKISVTQVAEKGKANKDVLKLLAKSLGIKKSQLQLISGETSRLKKFCCQQITKKELIQKLDQLLNS
ncbi:MAG: DUF167 domain-containing protein [Planctomycetaceae bacterium]|nr:DUF167 domain-containing protein [Planctomycetaceae bacterium]